MRIPAIATLDNFRRDGQFVSRSATHWTNGVHQMLVNFTAFRGVAGPGTMRAPSSRTTGQAIGTSPCCCELQWLPLDLAVSEFGLVRSSLPSAGIN